MSKTTTTLRESWNEVRRHFFPSWDRHGKWRVFALGHSPTLHGECDKDRRIVKVQVVEDANQMALVLIHEICHQVGGSGHGAPWQRRMTKAANRANKLGREKLAELLQSEIEIYQKPGVPIECAYDDVLDWVMANQNLSYATVKALVARKYCRLSEIPKLLPRLRQVFQDAKCIADTGD